MSCEDNDDEKEKMDSGTKEMIIVLFHWECVVLSQNYHHSLLDEATPDRCWLSIINVKKTSETS